MLIKIQLGCFLVHVLVHIYIFYDLKDILPYSLSNVHDIILLLYAFYSTIIFHLYLQLFLHHHLYVFLFISTIFVLHIPQKFQDSFISSFVSLSSLNTLFTETNSSSIIYESIKALEIKTSIAFNLGFPSNTVISWFFFFILIIDLYFFNSYSYYVIFNCCCRTCYSYGNTN